MTATAQPPAPPVAVDRDVCLDRAEGVELLGEVHGCGYRHGAALVRRADGQMVQLGALMYAVLECADGIRDLPGLADAVSDHLGRRIDAPQVGRLGQKLAAQGLLAGSEHRAPPRRNPLLALRWKVLVTNPTWTRRLTAPFTPLFRPWVMWPILAAFVATLWFVLVEKGVASATAQAFHKPELLLLVFALAVGSAAFHELGHAAAARYAGATPGGMGMGLYMVWPAFYTDVTDTYRLPRKDRLRVDLAGLYFNAAVAVVTMGVWLVVHADALLLLVGLQVLQMVKQLSPVIRADGYHILADATGVADLYAHMLPTVRRLLPGRRHERSALTGRARLIVTVWVLIVVPVILSLSLSAIILLPRLATTAWQSAQHFGGAVPGQVSRGQVVDVLASLVRLLALTLPVLGSVLVAQKIVRSTGGKAWGWSRGSTPRRAGVLAATAGLAALLAWAWWPAGQYRPVHGNENGTISGMTRLVSSPASVARPRLAAFSTRPAATPVRLAPGRHLAVAMIPVDGASKRHPALYVIRGKHGQPAAAILSDSAPPPRGPQATTAPSGTTTPSTVPSPGAATTAAAAAAATATKPLPPSATAPAVAFPFKLPSKPRPGDSQALATGTRDGGTTYVVAYSLVTVKDGAPVTNENSAYALASCRACTTVAVSFQVVLVVGTSDRIMPVDVAEALNKNCPACVTMAIANQMVITLKKAPSADLMSRLEHSLRELNALSALGGKGDPSTVLAEVTAVRKQIEEELNASGLPAQPVGGSTSSTAPAAATSSRSSTPSSTGSSSSGSSTATPQESAPTTTSTTPTTPTTTSTTPTTTSTTPTTTTSPSAPTSTTPSAGSTTSTTTTTPSTTSTTPTTTSSSPPPSTSTSP